VFYNLQIVTAVFRVMRHESGVLLTQELQLVKRKGEDASID